MSWFSETKDAKQQKTEQDAALPEEFAVQTSKIKAFGQRLTGRQFFI